jgi:hypothetical protein
VHGARGTIKVLRLLYLDYDLLQLSLAKLDGHFYIHLG